MNQIEHLLRRYVIHSEHKFDYLINAQLGPKEMIRRLTEQLQLDLGSLGGILPADNDVVTHLNLDVEEEVDEEEDVDRGPLRF